MKIITVYKLDENGREVLHYPATILEQSPTHIKLEAFFSREDMDLGYAVFKKGDRFVEFFYTEHWYNIFAIYDRDDDQFKGWYCNICRPSVVTETAVSCEDLALDLWVSPTGQTTVLDQDEFESLPITVEEKTAALQALNALKQKAKQQALPQ